jgi:hypothetical protein
MMDLAEEEEGTPKKIGFPKYFQHKDGQYC